MRIIDTGRQARSQTYVFVKRVTEPEEIAQMTFHISFIVRGRFIRSGYGMGP
jgi:hypothetical protein